MSIERKEGKLPRYPVSELHVGDKVLEIIHQTMGSKIRYSLLCGMDGGKTTEINRWDW